ncbi:MAG: helix-turn-helix transcriptional regulator [Chloroflexota bacterium]
MAAVERAIARGDRRAARVRLELGGEYRAARLAAGWSQDAVATGARMSRSHYVGIEHGRVDLAVGEASRIAAVLGLDLAIRAYPGSGPLRDAAHARRLDGLLRHAATALRVRREVPLPRLTDRVELRAWDAVVTGAGERTAFELEMRLHDTQALERRIALKRRDDPTDHFVLALADTKGNRRSLAANPTMFADLPRLGPSRLIRALGRGEHPPSCLVVL